jgi:hypothetical protein
MTTSRLARYFVLTLLVLVAAAITMLGMTLCFYPVDPATETFSDRVTTFIGLLMVSGGCGAAMVGYKLALRSGDGKVLKGFLALVFGIAAVFGATLVIGNFIPVSKDVPQVPNPKQIPADGLWLGLATLECAGTLVWLLRAEKMRP